MRSFAYSAALCLSAAALALPAQAADDIMVNGQHCNSLCQSWLGVRGTSAVPPVGTDASPVSQIEQRAIEPMPLHLAVTRPKPAAPARQLRTAAREVGSPSDLSPVSAIERRDDVRSSASLQPLLPASPLPLKMPEAALPSIKAPRLSRANASPRLSPAPTNAVQPQPLDVVPDAREDATFDDGTLPKILIKRHLRARAEASMEPGLKTLPHLNELVAVHGTIMIETAEERAIARRNMAELVKATTRPKEFRTGFADPFSDKPAAAQVIGQAR